MDRQVRKMLEKDFALLPDFHNGADMIATCRHGCLAKRYGTFAIPYGATTGDTSVQRAMEHAKVCAKRQIPKAKRQAAKEQARLEENAKARKLKYELQVQEEMAALQRLWKQGKYRTPSKAAPKPKPKTTPPLSVEDIPF
ncbi:MAG: hypothetical protein WCI73_11800, partial [Phycisphaerae bacterium]